MAKRQDWIDQIEDRGYARLQGIFKADQIDDWLDQIQQRLMAGDDDNIKTSRGETYAARNLIDTLPQLGDAWRNPQLTELLGAVLGSRAGLVRVLFFDKHPNRSWSLPWHRDMTIAVKSNQPSSQPPPNPMFTKPTRKSGVDHVEAPETLLQQMLTLRIHLDEVTHENGPLKVIRGSHLQGKSAETHPEESPTFEVDTIHAQPGDVLAMRPLLSHASGVSEPGTQRHRRILHFEFSGWDELPEGFEWHRFLPIDPNYVSARIKARSS